MNLRRLVASAFVPVALATLAACSSPQGDVAPDSGGPEPLGPGLRIRDVMNPTSKKHVKSNTTVYITGASFLTVDTFDETANGKSVGTVYLQDTGSTAPYSGTSLYSQTYSPANLQPAVGDVLDLTGEYDENNTISTFPAGEYLIQIFKPTVLFRYEYLPPTPLTIQLVDLGDYTTGLQWLNMLVTVTNVTLGSGLTNAAGRSDAYLTSTINGVSPQMSNELFDLGAWNAKQAKPLQAGSTIKSLTGIVTWFGQYHIAPRSPADIVLE